MGEKEGNLTRQGLGTLAAGNQCGLDWGIKVKRLEPDHLNQT